MKRMYLSHNVLFVIALFFIPGVSEAQSYKLNGTQIARLFIGTSSTWKNFAPMNYRTAEIYTAPSSNVLMKVPGGVAIAEYSIDFKNSKFCNETSCMDVVGNGDNTFRLVWEGRTVADIVNVSAGDRLGLFAQYAENRRLSQAQKAETLRQMMKMLPSFLDAMGSFDPPPKTPDNWDRFIKQPRPNYDVAR